MSAYTDVKRLINTIGTFGTQDERGRVRKLLEEHEALLRKLEDQLPPELGVGARVQSTTASLDQSKIQACPPAHQRYRRFPVVGVVEWEKRVLGDSAVMVRHDGGPTAVYLHTELARVNTPYVVNQAVQIYMDNAWVDGWIADLLPDNRRAFKVKTRRNSETWVVDAQHLRDWQ